MIRPIGPQYQQAKASRRVGLTHVSGVIERLMRIYGLDDELIEHQEQQAAEMQTEEFGPAAPVLAAAVPAGTQSTFAWFE